ncbi:unnamed protein product [Victoria cruziana]
MCSGGPPQTPLPPSPFNQCSGIPLQTHFPLRSSGAQAAHRRLPCLPLRSGNAQAACYRLPSFSICLVLRQPTADSPSSLSIQAARCRLPTLSVRHTPIAQAMLRLQSPPILSAALSRNSFVALTTGSSVSATPSPSPQLSCHSLSPLRRSLMSQLYHLHQISFRFCNVPSCP